MRRPLSLGRAAAILVLAVTTSAPAMAAPSVSVGAVTAGKTCTVYERLWLTRYVWATDFVKDCVRNFPGLHGAIQSALASSGKLSVSASSRGGYNVTTQVTDIGSQSTSVRAPTYSVDTQAAVVGVNVRLTDTRGRIIFGGLLTKKATTYSDYQNEIGAAVARVVSFRLVPLRVTENLGRKIRLNYGSPLVSLGATIQVTTAQGSTVRYNVSAADGSGATADVDNDGNFAGVTEGMIATLIEPEDPSANARRFEKVDLPN